MTRYAIDLYKGVGTKTSKAYDESSVFVFEMLPRVIGEGYYSNEHPVQIISIDGSPVNKKAIAYSLEHTYIGTTFRGIRYNDSMFYSDVYIDYWFPGKDRPPELIEGALGIYPTDPEQDYCIAVPIGLPFMDFTGNFQQEYDVVMTRPRIKCVYTASNAKIVVYSNGIDNLAFMDKDTLLTQSIKCSSTFREIPMVSVSGR